MSKSKIVKYTILGPSKLDPGLYSGTWAGWQILVRGATYQVPYEIRGSCKVTVVVTDRGTQVISATVLSVRL